MAKRNDGHKTSTPISSNIDNVSVKQSSHC